MVRWVKRTLFAVYLYPGPHGPNVYTFSHSACLRAFHVTIVTDVKALQWCCTSRQNGLSETWYHAGRRNVTQSTVSVGQSVQCWWGDPRVAMNGVVC